MFERESIRGRGTGHNPVNRFEGHAYATDEDVHEPLDETCRPDTQCLDDQSKSILSENASPDIGFNYSINPYRGCEHGCVYCYARPTHEYFGYSAGLDFETRIFVKRRAPELLRAALQKARWQPQMIAVSGVTDPYQPIEREYRITRQCLEVLLEFRNPVGVVTKNRLVTRDLDILSQLAAHRCGGVYCSITTLDLPLNRVLEPRTSSPKQRLDTVRALSDAGIPVGVMVAPVLPGLTDHEIPAILEAARDAGAAYANYIMLRLPYAVAPIFAQWLDAHYPERKEKVLNRLRSMRGGKLYRAEFGKRHRGEGAYAEQTETLFDITCRKLGLKRGPMPMETDGFRRPGMDQMELFGDE